jgi:hypothetical protein
MINSTLPKKAIEEFKQIYLEEYGEKLSEKDAIEKAIKLINLFKVIYKPILNNYGKSK